MREEFYEVMQINPHVTTNSSSDLLLDNLQTTSLGSADLPITTPIFNEDFVYGGPSIPSSPLVPALTTVVIRHKRSFIHRLSYSLTLTRCLTTTPHRSSGIRQAPEMKLKQRWILFAFILFSVILILILSTVKFRSLKLASHQLGITVDLEELTDRDKCPACFGVNLCPAIFQEEIELNDWNRFTMSRLVNVKNIFYATWADAGIERNVVLKKLAHNNELEQLDKSICDRHHGEGTTECDVSETVVDLIEKYKIEQQDPHRNSIILHSELIGKGTDILLCPSHRKMDFMVSAAKKFLRGQHHDTILANVLTMVLLNPEPLLLQAFPKSSGWPFPNYYGACGRIIVEEYVGRRLTTYYNEPFPVRAFLAKQLLEMANLFYENPTNFILYLTDITPDNFAVEEDTNIIRVIDLENIIVVDKEVIIQSTNPESDKLLESESMPCGRDGNREQLCFSFSTEDLCQRPHTDHNHYAICAGLLSPGALADQFPEGLLHSFPDIENSEFGNFREVLLKCKDPKLGNPNHHYTRIEAAAELISLLNSYLQSHQQKNRI